jgi:hypothetical protein
VFCLTALMMSQIQIFQMSSICISFNTASKFNVTGLNAMFCYWPVYFTVESGTFFRDMSYNPVHNECQEREFELERKLLLYHKCVEVVCAFRFLNIFIVSREQNNWKHYLLNITLYINRWFI